MLFICQKLFISRQLCTFVIFSWIIFEVNLQNKTKTFLYKEEKNKETLLSLFTEGHFKTYYFIYKSHRKVTLQRHIYCKNKRSRVSFQLYRTESCLQSASTQMLFISKSVWSIWRERERVCVYITIIFAKFSDLVSSKIASVDSTKVHQSQITYQWPTFYRLHERGNNTNNDLVRLLPLRWEYKEVSDPFFMRNNSHMNP